MAKVLLEKIIPPWGTALKLHSDQETHFTGHELQQVCAVWLVLQSFTALTTPNAQAWLNILTTLLRFNWHNLYRPSNTLAKAWLLVLLNLRSNPFGAYKLSPFEITAGSSMHMAPASLIQLIKREMI